MTQAPTTPTSGAVTCSPPPRITRLARAVRHLGLALLIGALGACGSLLPKAGAAPQLYTLDDGAAPAAPPPPAAVGATSLVVALPSAAVGHDSARIAYQRSADTLAYYTASQWVDVPARMLTPRLLRALQATQAFAWVQAAPSLASADWQLDTSLLRVSQDMRPTPSRAHVSLRAVLTDRRSQQLLAWREFQASAPAPSEDAAGGVHAAQAALQQLLDELAAFCAAATRQASSLPAPRVR